jgi:hypothetical protein
MLCSDKKWQPHVHAATRVLAIALARDDLASVGIVGIFT